MTWLDHGVLSGSLASRPCHGGVVAAKVLYADGSVF